MHAHAEMFDCSASASLAVRAPAPASAAKAVAAVATVAAVTSVKWYNCTFRDQNDCDVDGA